MGKFAVLDLEDVGKDVVRVAPVAGLFGFFFEMRVVVLDVPNALWPELYPSAHTKMFVPSLGAVSIGRHSSTATDCSASRSARRFPSPS